MRQPATQLLDQIRVELEQDGASPESISVRTGLDIVQVERAIQLIQSERQSEDRNLDLLRDNVQLLQGLLETARFEYMACPSVDNATSITSIINASLQTIKEIENRQDPASLLNEVLGRAVQPLFQEYIRSATLAANRLREQLLDGFGAEHHGRIDKVVKELISQVGRDASDQYRSVVERLALSLGCKPEDGKVQPLLRAVNGDGDETQGQ